MATKKTNTPETASSKRATQPAPAVAAANTEQPAAQASQEKPALALDPASVPAPGTAEESTAAGDPEGSAPSPEYRGLTAQQVAQKQAEAEPTAARPPEPKKTTKAQTPPEPKTADPYEELATQYAKHYPDNPTFHITSDKQVFLAGDQNLAVLHQGMLQTDEKIHTINVKR